MESKRPVLKETLSYISASMTRGNQIMYIDNLLMDMLAKGDLVLNTDLKATK